MKISRINAGRTNFLRGFACAVLLIVVSVSLAANWLAPAGYAKQYREAADAGPTRQHWLGTDEIGRDRFARVLYGTRISLLLAPAAALLSTLMAALVGGFGGYLGGRWARGAMAVTDLFLSLPWLFLLITVRALMPLNVPAVIVVAPAGVEFADQEQSQADLASIRAFRIEPLESLVLHRGTWHWGPFPLEGPEVRLFNVQGLRYAEDNRCVDLASMDLAVEVEVEADVP